MSLTKTSPHKDNYKLGGARIYIQRSGTTGLVCLGNVVGPSINPLIETLDHFTSFSGTRRKDRVEITAESYDFDFSLDEFTTQNLMFALRADTDSAYSQASVTNRPNNVAVVPGRCVKLDRRQVSNVSITDASDTFVEGTDYTVDYELGLIRWDNDATANSSVAVEFDCAEITGRQFNPGSHAGIQEIDSIVIAFLDNKGGVIVWEGINATITTNGAISLTDTDWSTIPMKVSILSTNSPTAPFGTIEQFEQD